MKKLFNLIPLYMVVSWVAYIMILTDMIDYGHPWDGILGALALIVGVFSTISSFTSVFGHLSDLGSLQEREAALVNAEEYLKETKEHVKMITEKTNLDENVLAKANVSHPIVNALEVVKRAQADLESSKNSVTHYKSLIAARKAGPFSWVVDMYGERLV